MARCESCMTSPVHPDKKCCFNCARVNTNCEVWHNCGEDCPGWDSKVKTNADRIRAMSDEELAEFLGRVKEPCDYCQLAVYDGACTESLCDDAMMKWLQQPVEVE